MVTINIAYTADINPADVTPVLTAGQVWAGLEHKIRHPEGFVPVIENTEVVSEKVECDVPVVVRTVAFKPGFRQEGPVEEICKLYEPSRVDFYQPDGTVISNIVSLNVDGALQLTFSFSWRHVEVSADDTAAVDELRKKHRADAQKAVESTILATRKMVEGGLIRA